MPFLTKFSRRVFMKNNINKRISTGNYPREELIPVCEFAEDFVDLEKKSLPGMKILREKEGLANYLTKVFDARAKELEMLNDPNTFVQEVNVLINLKCNIDQLHFLGDTCQKAISLYPSVTKIDKAIWFGAFEYYFENNYINLNETKENLLYSWVLLLLIVQEKEIEYRKTVDLTALSMDKNVVELILADWDKEQECFFYYLPDETIDELKEKKEKRNQLLAQLKREHNESEAIAVKTNDSWKKFIEHINSISSKENETIGKMLEPSSPRYKLEAIREYKAIIDKIEHGKYVINDAEKELLPVLEDVFVRFEKAPCFCRVETEEEKNFQIDAGIVALAVEPYTFNYLCLLYHQFRLNPGKQTAKEFLETALSCICKNLGLEEKKDAISIEQVITDFYNIVMGYAEKNEEVIELLDFTKLQEDTVSITGMPEYDYVLDEQLSRVRKLTEEIENSDDYEYLLNSAVEEHDINELIKQRDNEITCWNKAEEQVAARQLIVSLNIIYLFCDAIRIIVSNRHTKNKIKNVEKINKYRRDLTGLDIKLVQKVYSNLNDTETGILEYREQNGIITTSLMEQEVQEEKFANQTFGNILRESISELIENLDEKDINQLLEIKKSIRERILSVPDCDNKELYSDWLDEISNRLCDKLIRRCKEEEELYSRHKLELKKILGEKMKLLPDAVTDSLTTAEVLFEQYSSEKYAERGFDFSGISSLYYQAFENAYNKLIWNHYADYLNNLEIGGVKYTKHMENFYNGDLFSGPLSGYLHPKPKYRNNYIVFKLPNSNIENTKVKEHCMYKNFFFIINSVKKNSLLQKFCDYFSQMLNFVDADTMINDNIFMKMISDFTSDFYEAIDKRNNASHGGTIISIEQCIDDRNTVINSYKDEQNSSNGLIQQLLDMFEYKK